MESNPGPIHCPDFRNQILLGTIVTRHLMQITVSHVTLLRCIIVPYITPIASVILGKQLQAKLDQTIAIQLKKQMKSDH